MHRIKTIYIATITSILLIASCDKQKLKDTTLSFTEPTVSSTFAAGKKIHARSNKDNRYTCRYEEITYSSDDAGV